MIALLLLLGCGGADKADSDTSSVQTPPGGTPVGSTTVPWCPILDWTDDGASPADTDGDGLNDTGCGDSLAICIVDPLGVTNWDFGMAEEGAYGWTGEDCLNGYGAYSLCHPIGLMHVLNQVCRPDEVVPGQTTLLDAEKEPFLTYYLDDGAVCFTFGRDTSYYASLGCTEMM